MGNKIIMIGAAGSLGNEIIVIGVGAANLGDNGIIMIGVLIVLHHRRESRLR